MHVRPKRREAAKDSKYTKELGLPLVAQMVESACNVGNPGSIAGWGRPPGEGNSNPFPYSCLENPMDGEASAYSPWGRKELT